MNKKGANSFILNFAQLCWLFSSFTCMRLQRTFWIYWRLDFRNVLQVLNINLKLSNAHLKCGGTCKAYVTKYITIIFPQLYLKREKSTSFPFFILICFLLHLMRYSFILAPQGLIFGSVPSLCGRHYTALAYINIRIIFKKFGALY